jgi:hypothetical protein
LFFVPTALIAVFAAVVRRGQEIAGGPPFTFGTVVAQAFAAMSAGVQQGSTLWLALGSSPPRDDHAGSSEWMIAETLAEPAEADIVNRFGQLFSLDSRYPSGIFSGASLLALSAYTCQRLDTLCRRRDFSEENAARASARFARAVTQRAWPRCVLRNRWLVARVEPDLRERRDGAACVRAH